MGFTTLIPAYGRDYKSGKAAKADFAAGRDFIIANAFSAYDGKPANILDFKAGETVILRFKRNTGVTSFKVTAKAHAEAQAALSKGTVFAKGAPVECECDVCDPQDCPMHGEGA